LDAISSSARKVAKQLVEEGWAQSEQVAALVKTLGMAQPAAPALNDEQSLALSSIMQDAQQFQAWLLHGITGSGKTEVYMRLMQQVLDQDDAQVLVLVPEINLTPQLEARFRSRFAHFPLVSLHSHLSEGERLHHWQLAQAGAAKIVIGTRLSIFTPMPKLKLIIIDEEHDSSYKQQDSMRYHARDVALMRAKRLNIPVVLGSATPALETWHNAQTGKYRLLSLNQRAVTAAKLPQIDCIDTTKVHLQQGLSPQLIAALKLRLARKEQSLLFINRRGYSPGFIVLGLPLDCALFAMQQPIGGALRPKKTALPSLRPRAKNTATMPQLWQCRFASYRPRYPASGTKLATNVTWRTHRTSG
jgi:primosomal protein N' (replication factor Y)